MLKSYIYLLIQMLLILICINSTGTARRYAPAKVKILSMAVLILETLRVVSNGVLFVSDNILFLYILKYFNFLNIVVIPLAAVITLYIFYRSDSLKFDYVIIAGVFIFGGYLFAVFNMDYYIKRTQLYGYCIYMEELAYMQLVELILLSFVLISAMLSLGRKVANNNGLILIITAAVIAIAEIVLKAFNIELLNNQILGDAAWMIVLQYAINTMKTSKSR